MTPRATSRSIRLGFATGSANSAIANLWVLTCAISLVLLGSSPCWAQRKADAVLEFLPAPANPRIAGDAKIHTVVAAGRDGSAKLFSATARGLQVSEDAGRSWERLPVGG